MKRKLCLMLLTGVCFAALLTCRAYADSWLDRASPDSPVYPQRAPFETGDINSSGALDPADARLALRLSVGLEWDSGGAKRTMADINGDGVVSPADARQILRYSVGLDGYATPTADGSAYYIRFSSVRRGNNVDDGIERLLALTVNGAQPGDRRNSERLPLWRLCSAEDADRFADVMENEAGLEVYNNSSPSLRTLLKRYSKTFFETYDLFVCTPSTSCSSTIPAIFPLTEEEGVLTVNVSDVYTIFEQPDEVNRMFFIPVEKELTRDCRAFNAKTQRGIALTTTEHAAARKGTTRWEFANERLLEQDSSVALTTGAVYFAALPGTASSAARWVCEADCRIWKHHPNDREREQGDAGGTISLWAETVTAPGGDADAPILQLFTIWSYDEGDHTLRFRYVDSDGSDAGDGRTVRLTVNPRQTTVSDTVRWATENGALATSSQAPFKLLHTLFGYSTLTGQNFNCRFRGVIEKIDRYSVSWKAEDGTPCGPYPRAVLKVRVTRKYSGDPDKEYVNILYVYDPDNADAPVIVRTGQEYLFLDCRLLDDTYFEKAAAVMPDFAKKDETLRMADVIAGPAKYTFLPIDVDGKSCTVYREFFSEEQFTIKGERPEFPQLAPFNGSDYVTVSLQAMEDYLIEVENIQEDRIFF